MSEPRKGPGAALWLLLAICYAAIGVLAWVEGTGRFWS